MTGELDDRPDWERSLSASDRALSEAEEWIAEIVDSGGKVCRNPNCGLPKAINSSGRCAACMKYRQRHEGVERPRKDVEREILKKYVLT